MQLHTWVGFQEDYLLQEQSGTIQTTWGRRWSQGDLVLSYWYHFQQMNKQNLYRMTVYNFLFLLGVYTEGEKKWRFSSSWPMTGFLLENAEETDLISSATNDGLDR